MRLLVLTPKFKRAFRKFVKRNAELQQRIENTLEKTLLSKWKQTYLPQVWVHINWAANSTVFSLALVAMIVVLSSRLNRI